MSVCMCVFVYGSATNEISDQKKSTDAVFNKPLFLGMFLDHIAFSGDSTTTLCYISLMQAHIQKCNIRNSNLKSYICLR